MILSHRKRTKMRNTALLVGTALTIAYPAIARDKINFETAVDARPALEIPTEARIFAIPVPLPLPEQLKPDSAAKRAGKAGGSANPGRRIEDANDAARVEPAGEGFFNAIQQYPYADGALYQVYAAPGQVTDIMLQEGEQLAGSGPVAAGDTARWIIDDTTSGAGPSSRVHILVKPTRSDLKTNMIINTDRRTYHLELTARPATYMASVSWNYPQHELIALRGASARNAANAPIASGIDMEALNFRYKIKRDKPDWRPIRVYDDGIRVFVEFPENIAQGEMPPIFVIGESGQGELVNFRVSGRHLIVDRLFAAAELRLGDKKSEQKVRIIRMNPGERK